MKLKNIIYIIVSALAVAAIAVLIIAEFAGKTGFISDSSFEEVSQKVIEAADTDNMMQGDNQMIRRLYGLDPDDYDGVILYYSKTNMNAEELIVIKLKDSSQEEDALAQVEARLDTQLKSFEGYGAEQTAMLEASVIESRGGYILFISSDDTRAVKTAFEEAL